MDILRSLLTENFEILDKKIIVNDKVIENKYIEMEGETFTLLQALFYVKHCELPFEKYAKLAHESDIPVVNSKLIYYLSSNVTPQENYEKKKFDLSYDFRFILNHVVKKEYVILVPPSYSSKINIFNCVSALTTGSFKNPLLDRSVILVNERRLRRSIQSCTADFIFLSKWNEKVKAEVVAVFLDGSDWQIQTILADYEQKYFDSKGAGFNTEKLSNWTCPIFFVHPLNLTSRNLNYRFTDLRIENEKKDLKAVNKIWCEIERYIKTLSV